MYLMLSLPRYFRSDQIRWHPTGSNPTDPTTSSPQSTVADASQKIFQIQAIDLTKMIATNLLQKSFANEKIDFENCSPHDGCQIRIYNANEFRNPEFSRTRPFASKNINSEKNELPPEYIVFT